MTATHDKRYPGETDQYRQARSALLNAELELDQMVRKVAGMRRDLPPGGAVPQNYVFHTMENGAKADVRLSELFAPGKDTLFLYSYMYAPDATSPCPACTSLVDGFNGVADHVLDRVNMAVVAKAPIENFSALASDRGWSKLRFLSSSDNSYNDDYFAVNASGNQIPAANIFVKKDGEIRHFWGAELLYVERPGHPRHVDQIWPIWNILDLTPEGRGTDWFPSLNYGQ